MKRQSGRYARGFFLFRVPQLMKREVVCLPCNIWWSLRGAKVRLSEVDLRARKCLPGLSSSEDRLL